MSYILDSLKKSEQERQQQSVTSPLEQVYDPSLLENENQANQGVKKRIIVLFVAVLVGLLFVIFMLWKNNSTEVIPNADAPSLSSNEKLPSNNTASIEPVPAPNLPTSAPLPIKKPVAVIDKAAEVDQFYEKLAEAKKAPPVIKQAIKKPVESVNAKQKTAVEEKKAVVVAPPVPPQEDKPLIPFFNDLSPLTKDTVPTISYSAHVFAENNNNGFVVINRKKSRAGTRLNNGIFIEKIEEDDVVLSYDGVVFKMPAMTSWINN